jgi:hypothetical protein
VARFIAAAQNGFSALMGIQQGVIDQRCEIRQVAQAGRAQQVGPV